jgi:hypothetical protein
LFVCLLGLFQRCYGFRTYPRRRKFLPLQSSHDDYKLAVRGLQSHLPPHLRRLSGAELRVLRAAYNVRCSPRHCSYCLLFSVTGWPSMSFS